MAEIGFSNVFAYLLKYMDEAKTTRRTSRKRLMKSPWILKSRIHPTITAGGRSLMQVMPKI